MSPRFWGYLDMMKIVKSRLMMVTNHYLKRWDFISNPTIVIYNMYLQLGVDGLRGLENYDPITKVS